MARQRVLFLCPDNSTRSQIAEGFLRALAADRFEVQSAGPERRGIHPLAVTAMAERGIDISGHTSKLMLGLLQERWDYVIALYDPATERRPLFSGEPSDWTGSSRTHPATQGSQRIASNHSASSETISPGAFVNGSRPKVPDCVAKRSRELYMRDFIVWERP